jgi:hypothetical protein
MRHHMLTRLALAFALLLAPIAARAQDHNFPTPGGAIVDGVVLMCLDVNGNAVPATTAGTCLGGGGGSGTVNAGLINQIAYYAAGGTAVSGLATCASGVIVTSAGSVPSCSTTLPTGIGLPNGSILAGLGFTPLNPANNLSELVSAATARTNLGLGTSATVNTGTSGATIPLLNGTNTWANAQTFTTAPVFTDQSGSRSALGLGTMATQAASAVAITGGTFAGITSGAFRDASAAFDDTLAFNSSVALTAGRTLTIDMKNVAHTFTLGTTASTGSGIIFPNTATDTVAMLGVAQTFTAAQIINVTGNITALTVRNATVNSSFTTDATATVGLNWGTVSNHPITVFTNNATRFLFDTSGNFREASTGALGWNSGDYSTARDTSLSRLAAAVVQVGGASNDATGSLLAANLQTGGSVLLTLTAGAFGMSKMTASASAPGAAGGKLELVCGTNSGSAKLIAIAGTSATAVTVIDNIGSGVTGC